MSASHVLAEVGHLSQGAIYFAAVTNIVDRDLFGAGVNLVYDPIVAHPNTIEPFST